jgi:hypothetical protein
MSVHLEISLTSVPYEPVASMILSWWITASIIPFMTYKKKDADFNMKNDYEMVSDFLLSDLNNDENNWLLKEKSNMEKH